MSGLRVTCTAAPGVYLISRDRDVVASVTPERAGAGRDLVEAMAVAPDLLEALEALERYLRQTPHHNAIEAAAARKVIAKARGEEA